MMKQPLILPALAMTILLSTGSSFAVDQEQIYGSQLMTQQEQLEYRKKNTNAKTAQEREQIRMEHQSMINERAKERNIKLPDMPASGTGMSPGGSIGSSDMGGGRGR